MPAPPSRIVGTRQAAELLGVTPARVRQLVSAGVIPASKIGRSWVFDRWDLSGVQAMERHPGRPLSPSMAWAVLWLMAGRGDAPALPSYAASRARDYASRDLLELWPRLVRRATMRALYVHPSVRESLAADERLVLGGVSATYHSGLVSSDIEGYVRARDLMPLIKAHGLVEADGMPTVYLRLVPAEHWPFAPDERLAPRPVVAADLFERTRGGDRLEQQAREMLREGLR